MREVKQRKGFCVRTGVDGHDVSLLLRKNWTALRRLVCYSRRFGLNCMQAREAALAEAIFAARPSWTTFG